MYVICDIDGTIADATHRLHYIQSRPKDWNGFFAGVTHDEPHGDIAQIVNALFETYGHDVVLVSGRPERTREDTVKWIKRHLLWDTDMLFMRKDGDYRADDIVKEEILDNELIPRGITHNSTLAVFDDRDRVVAMWRRRGFRVLQVAPGDF